MPPFRLETRRLLLRDYRAEDWPEVHAYAALPEFSRFELWGPNTEAATRTYVGEMVEQAAAAGRYKFDLAVCEKQSGLLLGGSGLRGESEGSQVASLGWAISPAHQNQGYATEAAAALIDFGLRRRGLAVIYATCDTRNAASLKVMEKLGLKLVGESKGTRPAKDGLRDIFRFELPAHRKPKKLSP